MTFVPPLTGTPNPPSASYLGRLPRRGIAPAPTDLRDNPPALTEAESARVWDGIHRDIARSVRRELAAAKAVQA